MRLTRFSAHVVDFEKIRPHQHLVFEAHYIVAGTGYWKLFSEKKPLGPGDFFLVLPGQEHFVSSNKDVGLSQIIFFVDPEPSDQKLFEEIKKKWARGRVFPAGLNQAYFFETLRRRSGDKRPVWRDSAAAAFSNFLYSLLMRTDRAIEDASNELVESLLRTMYQNIRTDFSVKAEARRLGKSEAWLIRRFKEAMGAPPAHHYLRLKIEAAAESLRAEEETASQISAEYGFRDVFYFSKLFRKYTGLSPSVFRRRTVS